MKKAVLTIIVVVFMLFAPLLPKSAGAQSPSPTLVMTDVDSNHAYPAGYRAGIIEGLGAIGSTCDYSPYTPSELETTAVSWITDDKSTIIEITPQVSCDSNIADYESLLNNLSQYIYNHVSLTLFNRYWGGFMLDEEPSFWTSAAASHTAFDSLNLYAYDYESYDTQSPYAELGNYPGWWSPSQYDDVAAGELSTPAPQIYNTTTATDQNNLVASEGVVTLVTCYPGQYSAPFDTCAHAYGDISGTPFSYSTFGSGYWYNLFQS